MRALKVVKRTGEVVGFDSDRIRNAIVRAVAALGTEVPDASLDQIVDDITDEVDNRFNEFYPNVENIQDIVEKHLVRQGLYEIAKAYILYRAERQKVRLEAKRRAIESARLGKLTVKRDDGRTVLFNVKYVHDAVLAAAEALGSMPGIDVPDVDPVVREVVNNVYDEIPTGRISQAMVMAAAAFIERDPAYSYLAARLLLRKLYRDHLRRSLHGEELESAYRGAFVEVLRSGVEAGLYNPKLLEFDLERITAHLRPERDELFHYLGIQTLSERYLMRKDDRILELPQHFWMRVAMGLAINEPEPEQRALEFYELLSQLRYVASTPTLFHSGTQHPQLSSCYLTTIDDDLKHIFKSLGDNSQLSKWSGGIGNDWSNIRATGSPIKTTNVESQGVIPFLKIANDVTMAINRSGKRRGATCAYLETWHLDIEDFLDLRKNTGDERRRTHDMNTSNWIPDLFMKRVLEDGEWTLFSPDEVPDLHHIYGRRFEERYIEYEARAKRGEMTLWKTVSAVQLWRKMLTMLFETGHPWITFKDACNVRSPQDHVGVIHSSNLCTEITLNTSAEETAVCNLGSVNLARHFTADGMDREMLASTVRTAIRMLDNVIDINFYPTQEARNSNLKHRPIGLGVMGFQDALFKLNVPFSSQRALELADETQEVISYYAILASSELAAEREPYPSYQGSKWDRGIFPLDTLDLLEEERGVPVEISRAQRMDWEPVRDHVRQHGMRNSNTMAVAPTATISNISGCFPCIEPIYKNIYVKANISGEFTIVNSYLVEDLKVLGLWDEEMLDKLKYYDGNISQIQEIPDDLKEKYREAFEIDPVWCLKLTAARGKWIDQSQSHNVFIKGVSGKKLHDTYVAAWRFGLKTTYYLRSLGATQIEKSTLDASKYGYTQKREYAATAASPPAAVPATAPAAAVPAAAEAPSPAVPAATPSSGTPSSGTPSAGTPSAGVGRRSAPSLMPSAPDSGPQGGGQEAPRSGAKKPEPQLCRIDDPECEACQ
ncbi:MAG: ribonucleoside-diphosphate reductase subunit alpha [Acidobacteriota bacterium]|nr:ribonucleoside-diphosphate reductase subunit alpha [Acidobacteriota bacterium]